LLPVVSVVIILAFSSYDADGFNEAGTLTACVLLGAKGVGGGGDDNGTAIETNMKKRLLR
jgi:hypothetical protein